MGHGAWEEGQLRGDDLPLTMSAVCPTRRQTSTCMELFEAVLFCRTDQHPSSLILLLLLGPMSCA
jgi:hypothetical protein